MSKNNIDSYIRDVIRGHEAERDMCASRISSTKESIKLSHRRIENSMRLFSHHQLVENAHQFGEDVVSIVRDRESSFKRMSASVNDLQAELNVLNDKLESAKNTRSKEKESVLQELAKNKTYLSLQEDARQKTVKMTDIRNSMDGILDEINQKLPAYESDEVFQYLRSCNYGTSSYSKNLIVEFIDGIIAKKSHYASNVESYNLMTNIKDKIKQELENAEINSVNAIAAADGYRDDALRSGDLKKFGIIISDLQEQIRSNEKKIREILDSQGRYKSFSDELSMTAKAIIYKAIENKDFIYLQKLAMQTSTDEDNKALEVIGQEVNNINNLEDQLEEYNQDKTRLDDNLERSIQMKKIINSSSRLSGDRYEYTSANSVKNVLDSFVVGAITSSALSSALESSSRYVPPPVVSSYDSGYGGNNFGNTKSSDSNDSAFSTTDSISSGSFTTTDSF